MAVQLLNEAGTDYVMSHKYVQATLVLSSSMLGFQLAFDMSR